MQEVHIKVKVKEYFMVLLHEKFSGHPTHGVEGVVRVGMGGAFDQTGGQYENNSLNFVSFIKERFYIF